MKADHLIIGQGIAGSLLARLLLRGGRSVLVIDDGHAGSSSRAAAGIINPVTGMRMVKSWMIDELIPAAQQVYGKIEQEADAQILFPCPVVDFFQTRDAEALFQSRSEQEPEYLSLPEDTGEWQQYFRYPYGVGQIAPAFYVQLRVLQQHVRGLLQAHHAYREEKFDQEQLQLTGQGVIYKDITAQNIVFCDGADGENNRWFGALPWSKDKGEAIIVSIPGLPRNRIYKYGLSIVPWQDGDLFWVGARHDWKYIDMQPTATFRQQVAGLLDSWLQLPYVIVDHLVARRPANVDRKPFLGFHPRYPQVGICNGFGGKGCSLAPYFVRSMVQHMVHGNALPAEVSISRFARILSR